MQLFQPQSVTCLEKSALCRCLRLKRQPLQEFLLQLGLLLLGVREAYLVDCFCVDSTSLLSLLEMALALLGEENDSSEALVVVEVPTQDYFILSAEMFLRRVDSQCGIFENMVLVDISGSGKPRVVTQAEVNVVDDHMRSLVECIVNCCRGQLVAVNLLSLAPDTTILGYECFAGWLLGYSCIYNCPVSKDDQSSRYENSLSMLPLRKMSIMACVEAYNNLPIKTTVREFTIPCCILSVHSNDISLESHFDYLIRNHLEVTSLKCQNMLGCVIKVELMNEDVTYPSLVF